MITISKTAKAIQRFFEAMAKARVNSTLLGMGREKIEVLGYSYEALRMGPSAWPWRKTTQKSAGNSEAGTAISSLNVAEIDNGWTLDPDRDRGAASSIGFIQ